MTNYKIAFVIDKVEFQYFEINELVTTFWLIKECLGRNWDVYITTSDRLALRGNIAEAQLFKTSLTKINGKLDLIREKDSQKMELNSFNMVLFRPDPPVDMDYIFATYIIDYIDTSKTVVLNSSEGLRKANEKIYINNFPHAIPENITTSNIQLIKDFLEKNKEIIIKPLNRCFGKGVFYLKKGDNNINSIIDIVTDHGKTVIMAQKYIEKAKDGDKRIIIIGGEVYEESVIKISSHDDFKFNTHKDEFIKKSPLTDKEKEICQSLSAKLIEDGLHFVGIDMIDNQIIEINVTSPCFFIKEINAFFDTNIEIRIVDYMEHLIYTKNKNLI